MNSIPMPLEYVGSDGHIWYLYDIQFDTPEGTLSVYMPAISKDHADLLFIALKESGRITGRVVGVVPGTVLQGNDDDE